MLSWLLKILQYIILATLATVAVLGVLVAQTMLQNAVDERRGYAVGRPPRRRARREWRVR